MMSNRIFRPSPNPDARLNLVCLPSAGSGPSMYRAWGKRLPDDVDVIGVHLPGREALIAEPLQDSIESLAATVQPVIEPFLDRPFALFGHSMGAWIAFELTRTLVREGKPLPVHFFASGRRAPQIRDPRTAVHTLDDDELVQKVMSLFGGIPAAVLAEPELMELLLPVLRADLKAVETYHYEPGPMLPCPVTAFGGQADSQVSLLELEGWGEQTQQAFETLLFPGAHFYLNETSGEELCRAIGQRLRYVMAQTV